MKRNDRFYIDFHVLQTVPPSCINRDDTGSPKTAQYGGVTRARVSSQAWKHAMRDYFNENIESWNSGFRTLKASEIITQEILSINPDIDQESAKIMAQDALNTAGIKCKDKGTEALFFISQEQAHEMAKVITDESNKKGKEGTPKEEANKKKKKDDPKKKYQEALIDNPSFDMALFGRMTAGEKGLGYDAASQVAHSISTHAVRTEYDYFTAVDDCASDDSMGAAHLNTTEYNSSTLYRYANINVCELQKTLGENPSGVIRGFAEAFCRSMPTGKQNSFANCTLPDMVYVTIRRDQPINLVGAFEKPVYSEGNGFVIPSEKNLIDFAKKMYENFAPKPEVSFGTCSNERLGEIAELMPLSNLFDKLEQYVKENVPELKGQA